MLLKKIYMNLSTCASATVLLVSLGLSTASQAAIVGSVISGADCQPYFGSEASSFNFRDNGIKNVSSGSRWVTCPLVRQNVSSTNGTTFALVQYIGSGTLSCSNYNWNSAGTQRTIFSKSRNGSGNLTLPGFATSYTFGAYTVRCYVPSGGTIIRTSLEEL